MSALPVPDGLPTEPNEMVTEIIRVWWNETQPAMIIRPALQDPAVMGIILGELALQFSRAYAQMRSMPQDETLATIRSAFDKAMAAIPQDTAEANQ